MRNKNKGFTLLELLVVIAIIGILSAVVIASLNDSRSKAKTAAFKSEMDSLVPSLISVCHDRALVASDVPGGSAYRTLGSDPSTQACGPASVGTFSIDIDSTNGSACTSATLTESGVTYNPSGC